MDNLLLIGGIILFIYLGGLGWLRSVVGKVQEDRERHKGRTEILETENRRLRQEVDELWDRVSKG